MNRIIFSSVFFLYSLQLFAVSDEFTKILHKYSNSNSVEVNVKKTDEKLTLGTKTISEGVLKFSKDKIYILFNGDKKIEFYYRNKTIWLVEYPDLDFDKNGKRKVTILKKSTPVLMSSLINLFSDQKKFFKEFKMLSEKKDQDVLTVDFKPSEKNMKSFSLSVGLNDKTINKVVFTDDVDTKTTLELDKLKLNKKVKSSDFQFTKLSTDEVTTE